MPTMVHSYPVFVNVVPEVAFAYVADLSRHPEWSGAPLKITELAEGPIAIGKEYISRGDIPGQKDRPNQLQVSEYQPSTRFSFIAKDPDFGDVPHTFSFAPQAGGTLVTRIVTVTLPPLKSVVFRLFIRPLIGKPQMNRCLAALKARLEAGDA